MVRIHVRPPRFPAARYCPLPSGQMSYCQRPRHPIGFPLRMATHAEVRLLEAVEIDGRSIAFDYGVVLVDAAEKGGGADWHALLLRVASGDALRVASRAQMECAVMARTREGEVLVGSALVVPFASTPDGLRLVGSSALRRMDN